MRWKPLVLLAMLWGCSGSTGGALVRRPFMAGGLARDSAGPLVVTTPTGWTVTLETALIAVGPFYFNVSAPPTDEFRGGLVIDQVTRQVVIDALDPALHDVPDGVDGETGRAISVEIGLLAPDDTQEPSAASALGNGFAVVRGTAVRGSTAVSFGGRLVIDKTLVTATSPLDTLQRVKGAAVDLTFTTSPAPLVLRVNPSHWFDLVDFNALAAAPIVAGRHSWQPNSVFENQLLQVVQGETGVYDFALEAR